MWEKCWVNRWNMEHTGIVGKHRETAVIPEKHRECLRNVKLEDSIYHSPPPGKNHINQLRHFLCSDMILKKVPAAESQPMKHTLEEYCYIQKTPAAFRPHTLNQ